MPDNTQLSPGSGGDIINTKSSLDYSTGVPIETKTQVVYLTTGDGLVSALNPLPTEDRRALRILEQIVTQQDAIIAQNDTAIALNKQILTRLGG